MGNNSNDVDDRAYSFARSALHELNSVNAQNILITMGDPIMRLADVGRSMKAARHIRHIYMHQPGRKLPAILGANDMCGQSIALESLDLQPLYEH